MRSKEKTYKFSQEGLQKAFADSKQEKIDRYVSIGFWVVMLALYGYGTFTTQAMVRMVSCSATSKTVKFLMG